MINNNKVIPKNKSFPEHKFLRASEKAREPNYQNEIGWMHVTCKLPKLRQFYANAHWI